MMILSNVTITIEAGKLTIMNRGFKVLLSEILDRVDVIVISRKGKCFINSKSPESLKEIENIFLEKLEEGVVYKLTSDYAGKLIVYKEPQHELYQQLASLFK